MSLRAQNLFQQNLYNQFNDTCLDYNDAFTFTPLAYIVLGSSRARLCWRVDYPVNTISNDTKDSPFPDGILLEPQSEGGFVTYSSEYPGAVGQGETEEEAINDLNAAIELLKEYLEKYEE